MDLEMALAVPELGPGEVEPNTTESPAASERTNTGRSSWVSGLMASLAVFGLNPVLPFLHLPLRLAGALLHHGRGGEGTQQVDPERQGGDL